ncbi:MntP/YtaF family protein [Merdibacter massiliensis]|uniref:hypothetical protein n=1 Tax=Merdibacter massiliensis TaxID=1871030 RepID=UPI00096A5E90|nr:hypothetical protein [Merdibacter massiliensis]
MLQGILLVIALSLDSCLASFAYTMRQIQIPFKSAVVIALISAAFLGFSFLLSVQFVQWIPSWIASICSASVFACLSIYSFFQSAIKRMLRKNRKGLTFRWGSMQIVLDIYLDEAKADQDHSCILSVKEAFYLAIALSFDSLFSGIALGFSLSHPVWIVVFDFIVALFSIYLPSLCMRSYLQHRSMDFGWLSAFLFALLALSRLL